MADKTAIEWTDATWNPITGCSVVSPGCTNCYAMKLAGGRLKHHPTRRGLTVDSKAGPVWNGQVRMNDMALFDPLRWARPREIFVCAHSDLFHENVPDAWIDLVVIVMAIARRHTFQVLTKRSARMRAYFSDPNLLSRLARTALDDPHPAFIGHPDVHRFLLDAPDCVQLPLPNVWLGVSAEDQKRADERIPDLRATPAAIRFLSAEPLLGPMDLYNGDPDPRLGGLQATQTHIGDWWEPGDDLKGPPRHGVDWVIVGGESGPGARPMHPDWVRSLRDQCISAETVDFFFKQWGAFAEFEAGQPNREVDADDQEAKDILAHLTGGFALVQVDGKVWRDPDDIPAGVPARLMINVGKKAAGRLLDGVEHSGMPETRP